MLGKKIYKPLSVFLLILVIVGTAQSSSAQGQSADAEKSNTQKESGNYHSPHKATMYSALVPGLGQVYNQKYWKLPIIYGLTGVLIYSFDFNNEQYNKYKNAYADFEAEKIDRFEGYTDKEIILRLKDRYRRNRDLNVIVMAGIYMLNIIDATVDAHLYDYDISENLSLNIQPTLKRSINNKNALGITCRFAF